MNDVTSLTTELVIVMSSKGCDDRCGLEQSTSAIIFEGQEYIGVIVHVVRRRALRFPSNCDCSLCGAHPERGKRA
jgi:hypothetical protein